MMEVALILKWLVKISDFIISTGSLLLFTAIFVAYGIIMVIGFFIGIDVGPKDNLS